MFVFYLSMVVLPTKMYADTDYSIGDTRPAGGFIIYVNGNDYLKAAPTDQGSTDKWSNITNSEAGAWDATIGAGQSNTNIIINQVGHLSSAAKMCDDLVITNNGIDYDD